MYRPLGGTWTICLLIKMCCICISIAIGICIFIGRSIVFRLSIVIFLSVFSPIIQHHIHFACRVLTFRVFCTNKEDDVINRAAVNLHVTSTYRNNTRFMIIYMRICLQFKTSCKQKQYTVNMTFEIEI